MDAKRVDDLVRRFAEALPAGAREIGQEIEGSVRTLLNSAISSLNLVTREEFEVQSAVLARTRQKIEALEQQVIVLEQQLGIRPKPPTTPVEEPYVESPALGGRLGEQLGDPARGDEPVAPRSVPRPPVVE
jgi:BMFP domain-containing protein YqiC